MCSLSLSLLLFMKFLIMGRPSIFHFSLLITIMYSLYIILSLNHLTIYIYIYIYIHTYIHTYRRLPLLRQLSAPSPRDTNIPARCWRAAASTAGAPTTTGSWGRATRTTETHRRGWRGWGQVGEVERLCMCICVWTHTHTHTHTQTHTHIHIHNGGI